MEGFIIITTIFIVFIWVNYYFGKKSLNKSNTTKEDRFKRNNIRYEFKLSHISGYPYAGVIDLFQIKNDNKIFITSYWNIKHGELIGDGNPHEIPIENILRIENKTEEEISKDITIPRILVGGIFALAKPKKTVTRKEYLYLSYIDSGVQIDCLFEGEILGKLTSLVNQLRIEKNINR